VSSIPDMFDHGWPVLAYLLITLYAGLVVGITWQLITQRPTLVIDHQGIHQGRRRSMPWTEISSIGPVSGPKMSRQLEVFPTNVWAKHLTLSQFHVNDLQAFRTWLNELLAEQRRTATSHERAPGT